MTRIRNTFALLAVLLLAVACSDISAPDSHFDRQDIVLSELGQINRGSGSYNTFNAPYTIGPTETREIVISLNMRPQDITNSNLAIRCVMYYREVGTTEWLIWNENTLQFPQVLSVGERPTFSMGQPNEWLQGRQVAFEIHLTRPTPIGATLELL